MKKIKQRVFYEAVDAHARRRLTKHRVFYEAAPLKKTKQRPFYEAADEHARRRLKKTPCILWSGRRACASPLEKQITYLDLLMGPLGTW